MAKTELRMQSERGRSRPGGNLPLRRWLAVILVLLSFAAAYAILSRDTDWEERGRASRAKGDTAYHNGNYRAAGEHYENILADNPYDWEVHLALANILAQKLNDPDDALRHHTLALAYSPEPTIVEDTKQKIAVLRLLRSGELENPYDAIEDMFLAVERDSEDMFARRLSVGLGQNPDPFWNAWKNRGRGAITHMSIVSAHDGFYDAALELDFPDSTSMSMHLRAPIRDIWLLDLSFP